MSDGRENDEGAYGNFQPFLDVFTFSWLCSAWSFKFLQSNFAAGRTKRGEFRARWVNASMNKDDYVKCSRFRSNILFKEPFIAISAITPSRKKYDFILHPVFESANSPKEDVRQSLSCLLLHRLVSLFRCDAACPIFGHFPHRVFHFRWNWWVQERWIYCLGRSLPSSRQKRRALCIWLKSGF